MRPVTLATWRHCSMISSVCWEGVRVTLGRAAYETLVYIMPASGSRSEFPEWSGDTWSQHRLLTAQGTGDVPETSR